MTTMSDLKLEYWRTRRYCACGCHRHITNVDAQGRTRTRIKGHNGKRQKWQPMSAVALQCIAEATLGPLRLQRRGWMRDGSAIAFREETVARLIRSRKLRWNGTGRDGRKIVPAT